MEDVKKLTIKRIVRATTAIRCYKKHIAELDGTTDCLKSRLRIVWLKGRSADAMGYTCDELYNQFAEAYSQRQRLISDLGRIEKIELTHRSSH